MDPFFPDTNYAIRPTYKVFILIWLAKVNGVGIQVLGCALLILLNNLNNNLQNKDIKKDAYSISDLHHKISMNN